MVIQCIKYIHELDSLVVLLDIGEILVYKFGLFDPIFVYEFDNDRLLSCCYLNDGLNCLIGTSEGCLYNITIREAFEKVQIIGVDDEKHSIEDIHNSYNGDYIYLISQSKVSKYDLGNKKLIKTMENFTSKVIRSSVFLVDYDVNFLISAKSSRSDEVNDEYKEIGDIQKVLILLMENFELNFYSLNKTDNEDKILFTFILAEEENWKGVDFICFEKNNLIKPSSYLLVSLACKVYETEKKFYLIIFDVDYSSMTITKLKNISLGIEGHSLCSTMNGASVIILSQISGFYIKDLREKISKDNEEQIQKTQYKCSKEGLGYMKGIYIGDGSRIVFANKEGKLEIWSLNI
jgi:hypothetical protein